MKKKIISLFCLFFISLFIIPPPTHSLVPPPTRGQQSILGQNHSYSVTFRGNGEVVVSLKVILSNLDEEASLSQLSLRVPKVNPQDIFVYQAIRQPRCLKYVPLPGPSTDSVDNTKCLEYETEFSDYYSYGTNKYQKAQFKYKGDTISITLPAAIEPNGAGSFIVYYRAFGYTKKNFFGAYKYSFETLKVDDKINSLKVGINTDSDLYLQGAKGKVEYRFGEGVATLKASVDQAAFANNQLDSYYQQIGYGQINKTASSLQPLESYTVTGSYADSRLKLYAKGIVAGFVLLILIILFVVWLIKFLFKKFFRKESSSETNSIGPLIISCAASFITSFAVVGYTILVFILASLITSNTYNELSPLLMVLLLIISIGVYSVITFLPALFIGIKKGINWGIITFGMTIFWLIFYSVIIFMVVFLSSNRRYSIQPMQMMKSIESVTNPSVGK